MRNIIIMLCDFRVLYMYMNNKDDELHIKSLLKQI